MPDRPKSVIVAAATANGGETIGSRVRMWMKRRPRNCIRACANASTNASAVVSSATEIPSCIVLSSSRRLVRVVKKLVTTDQPSTDSAYRNTPHTASR